MAASFQLNLLPDLKQSSVRQQKLGQAIKSIAIIVGIVSVGLFLIMLSTVYVVQSKLLSDANKNIATYSGQLSSTKDLNQILTIQNQLTTLSELHKKKHAVSHIFTYMPQVTPSNVSLSNLSLDLMANTMQLSGIADSTSSVNVYVDTLKLTTFTIGDSTTAKTAFPAVILSGFGASTGRVSFSFNITFDPVLFSNSSTDSNGRVIVPKLTVPKLTSTHASLDNSASLLLAIRLGKGI